MLFNSAEYLFIFLPIVFIIYFLLNKLELYNWAKLFLLIASIYFYGSYKWSYVYIIICSLLFNYFISYIFKKDVTNKVKKFALIFGVSGNILILIFFKYFHSLAEIVSHLNLFGHFDMFNIIMPLGISFFTLQQISYIVDCYKQKFKDYNLLDYALFVCFFPQLIAGPIVRHQEMIPQFNNLKNRVINHENIFIGIFLLTIGLLKKTIFADGYVTFIDYISNSNITDEFYISWLFCLAKTLQVYFDFSGYCDMAIGSAFLFNISLPWNFNSPFQAQSMIDFWKRWNMTLIRFLREYIYKPLDNSIKQSKFKTFLTVNIVFLTMGIWCGCSILNILYGLINGLFVYVNILWRKTNIKLNKYFSGFITFISVLITVQFMSAKDIHQLISLFKTMLGINAHFTGTYISNFNLIFKLEPPHNAKINILILLLGLFIIFFSKNSTQLSRLYVKANNVFYTFLLAITFIIAVLTITRSNEFVYFIF